MCAASANYDFTEVAEIVRNGGELNSLSEHQIELVTSHGFAAILYQRSDPLISEGSLSPVFAKLRQTTLIYEATAMVRFEALESLMHEAASHEIEILLMKGAALSYQIYPTPGSRASSDMDILINESDIQNVQALFIDLGYRLDMPAEKSMLSFQFSALKQTETGHTLVFDIHYRINNRLQYARYFDFKDLCERSSAIPEFKEAQVQALSLADAYTFACVHLQGHLLQGDPIKAFWLYDIHLLLGKLSAADQAQINAQFGLFKSDELGVICRYWTERVCQHFETVVPEVLKAGLSQFPDISSKQRSNPLKLLWQQVRHLPSSQARATFLRQLLFPPKHRLQQKYPDSKLWTPLLYLRRAAEGLRRRLSKTAK